MKRIAKKTYLFDTGIHIYLPQFQGPDHLRVGKFKLLNPQESKGVSELDPSRQETRSPPIEKRI